MANKSTIPSSSNPNFKSSSYNNAINFIQLLSSCYESNTGRGVGGKNIRETLQSQLFLTPSPRYNQGNVMIGGASREMQMRHGHFSHASSSSSSPSIIDDIIKEISQIPQLKIDPVTFLKPSMSSSGHPILLSVSSHLPPPNENWTTILTINPSVGLCLHQIKNPDTPTTTNIDRLNNINGNGGNQIRSVPYKKNGPYTCPRCNQVFATSQKFAAHTTSHYKYETKDEKKKRLSSKIRKRNLHPQKVNKELTFVPASSQDQVVSGGVSHHVNGCGRSIRRPVVKVEVDQDRIAAHVDGVKVKSEPAGV